VKVAACPRNSSRVCEAKELENQQYNRFVDFEPKSSEFLPKMPLVGTILVSEEPICDESLLVPSMFLLLFNHDLLF
jgi:hypothetical protein